MKISSTPIFLLALIICSSATTLCGANEAASGVPNDLESAVAKRRGKTALSKLAAEMKPGSWAELECERPERLMSVFTGKRPSGKDAWYHIAGWTDDGKWDSRTGQFLYMGYRKKLKFIAYSEMDNKWRVLPGPFSSKTFTDTRKTAFGHVYAKNAYDPARGLFYHSLAGYTYRYSLADDKWTRFPGGSGMSNEFFPDLNGLIAHHRKSGEIGTVKLYDEKKKQWTLLADVPVCGYHSLARYNPLLNEMLLMGGNQSLRSVVRIDRKGQVHKLADAPVDMTIRSDKLLVDPVSGRYLLFNERNLYEFDSVKNTYQKVENYTHPWSKHEMPVPAAIAEYGVLMFIDKKVMLYKHNAPAFDATGQTAR